MIYRISCRYVVVLKVVVVCMWYVHHFVGVYYEIVGGNLSIQYNEGDPQYNSNWWLLSWTSYRLHTGQTVRNMAAQF